MARPSSISLSFRPTLLPPRQRRARHCRIISSSWRGSHLRRFTSWRTEIGSLGELARKKVTVGPQGSSSAATATALFKALGISVESQHLDASAAIERLKQGTIDAAVIVGGKPYPLVTTVPANSGIHLLPVPFGASLEATYLPTRVEQHDYPNVIQPGGEVPTVATGIVLLAAKGDPRSAERVAHFVEVLFPRFAELQTSDRHPKWREVNLAASLSGFSRTPAAAAWLNARTAETGQSRLRQVLAPLSPLLCLTVR